MASVAAIRSTPFTVAEDDTAWRGRIGPVTNRWSGLLLKRCVFAAACWIVALSGAAQAVAAETGVGTSPLATPGPATPAPAVQGLSAHGLAKHGLAMYGEPGLAFGFPHLPYANPDAPKGGRLTLAQEGSFDALNPLILKGNAPAAMVPYVVQPLMLRSLDEPFTVYGLLAESVETPLDRSWVEFRLDRRARFSDDVPVTSADVAFSWQLLRDHGRPAQRSAYAQVGKVETPDAQTVRFTIAGGNYELPMILALMPVFARHATDPATFEDTSLTMPLGSGPYRMSEINPGSTLTLKLNPGFWGNALPVLRGLYNFDEIKFDFYRDPNSMFEAFKSGLYDIRIETGTVRWLTAYDFPALRTGAIIRETATFRVPKPMTGFVFNTRRPVFADIRVRQALSLMFDFEWLNANLFANVFRRTQSYFADSALSSHGRPADALEAELLGPLTSDLDPAALDGTLTQPVSDGSGRDRSLARKATALLEQAGYAMKDGAMRSRATGAALTFEIVTTSREKLQIASAYADSLKLIGVRAVVRLADSSQYWGRLRVFDFDMIIETYLNSASPGTEQVNRWSSAAAGRDGSLNYAGVRSKAVDAMIAALLASRTPDAFTAAARALDRALLSGATVIPLYYAPERWLAHTSRVAHPERWPRYDLTPDTWWATRQIGGPARD